MTQAIYTVEEENADLKYIRAYSDSNMEYDKIIIYLHGAYLNAKHGVDMLESGIYGREEDIQNIMWIFPNANVGDTKGTWFDEDLFMYPENDCDHGVLDKCSYDIPNV